MNITYMFDIRNRSSVVACLIFVYIPQSPPKYAGSGVWTNHLRRYVRYTVSWHILALLLLLPSHKIHLDTP